MCSFLMPRLRAASSVRSSRAEPTPWLCQGVFDAEGGLGLARERRPERAQFGRAAQHAVDEEAVHHGAEPEGRVDVVADELIRHAAAEPAVPAFAVEAQQMVAVVVGFADPQFADEAAIGERFLHRRIS